MSKNSRKIIRELRALLNVGDKDMPRTLQRFKREIEEMEKELE